MKKITKADAEYYRMVMEDFKDVPKPDFKTVTAGIAFLLIIILFGYGIVWCSFLYLLK